MKRRKFEESVFKGLMIVSVCIIVAVLAAILLVITLRGASSLNLSMLIETPKGGYYLGKGRRDRKRHCGFPLPFTRCNASFLPAEPSDRLCPSEGVHRSSSGERDQTCPRHSLGHAVHCLWCVRLRGHGHLGLHASLLGGIIALTLLMLPIMTRSMEEVIRMIPPELKETSYALGATRIETTLRVVFRQALPGIMTGILLAFGRGIGDAASILFTAGYTDYIPRSLFDPVASLPLAVFFQVATPIAEVQQRAYASALILLVIVLVVSVASRLLSRRFSRHIVR